MVSVRVRSAASTERGFSVWIRAPFDNANRTTDPTSVKFHSITSDSVAARGPFTLIVRESKSWPTVRALTIPAPRSVTASSLAPFSQFEFAGQVEIAPGAVLGPITEFLINVGQC